jgi:hypothetical protein
MAEALTGPERRGHGSREGVGKTVTVHVEPGGAAGFN